MVTLSALLLSLSLSGMVSALPALLLPPLVQVVLPQQNVSCQNMTLSPQNHNGILRVEIVTGCFLEVNGTEVSSIHSGSVASLREQGVIVTYHKTGPHLTFDLNSQASATIHITCRTSCASISLPLESPTVPSNGNLRYSWAYIDGANVTVASVVCHPGYTMVGNNTESVFRPVDGDWQWTGPLSGVSCERVAAPPVNNSEGTKDPIKPVDSRLVTGVCVGVSVVVAVSITVVLVVALMKKRQSTPCLPSSSNSKETEAPVEPTGRPSTDAVDCALPEQPNTPDRESQITDTSMADCRLLH